MKKKLGRKMKSKCGIAIEFISIDGDFQALSMSFESECCSANDAFITRQILCEYSQRNYSFEYLLDPHDDRCVLNAAIAQILHARNANCLAGEQMISCVLELLCKVFQRKGDFMIAAFDTNSLISYSFVSESNFNQKLASMQPLYASIREAQL